MKGELETLNLEVLLGASRRTLVAAAHELKAPLSLIRMYAARLDDATLTDAQRSQYSARLLFTAEQMLQLASGLLEGYRWEQGRLPLEPVNIHVTCEEVLHELSPVAHELGQRLMLGSASRSAVAVGHAQLLKNVLFNIVFNALKHTPPGTSVTLDSRRHLERMYISVVDTGPGFGKHIARQVNTSASTGLQAAPSRTGSGLGLAVAKQLLACMNGSLQLKASPKGGHCLVSLHASKQLALPL